MQLWKPARDSNFVRKKLGLPTIEKEKEDDKKKMEFEPKEDYKGDYLIENGDKA